MADRRSAERHAVEHERRVARGDLDASIFFCLKHRSMPTANAEDLSRSEGTQRRVSPRPLRRYSPTRPSPRRSPSACAEKSPKIDRRSGRLRVGRLGRRRAAPYLLLAREQRLVVAAAARHVAEVDGERDAPEQADGRRLNAARRAGVAARARRPRVLDRAAEGAVHAEPVALGALELPERRASDRLVAALYRLSIGIADGMSVARGVGVPVLKMPASERRSF